MGTKSHLLGQGGGLREAIVPQPFCPHSLLASPIAGLAKLKTHLRLLFPRPTLKRKKKTNPPPPFFRPRQSASTSSSSPAPTAPAARPSSSWEAAPRRCSRPSPGTGATSEGGTSRSSRPGAGSTTGPWRRRWRGATWQEREAPTSRCLPRARPSSPPPPPPPPPPPLSLSLSTQSCRDTHLQPFLLLLLPQPLLCRSAHRCCSSSS